VAIAEIWLRLRHSAQGVADRLRQWWLSRDFGQLRMQPRFQRIKNGLCPGLTHRHAVLGSHAPDFLLDGVEQRNPADRLFGDSAALRGENIHELPPHMRHARHLVGFVIAEQPVEPGQGSARSALNRSPGGC
jgi:hypothetical protein